MKFNVGDFVKECQSTSGFCSWDDPILNLPFYGWMKQYIDKMVVSDIKSNGEIELKIIWKENLPTGGLIDISRISKSKHWAGHI